MLYLDDRNNSLLEEPKPQWRSGRCSLVTQEVVASPQSLFEIGSWALLWPPRLCWNNYYCSASQVYRRIAWSETECIDISAITFVFEHNSWWKHWLYQATSKQAWLGKLFVSCETTRLAIYLHQYFISCSDSWYIRSRVAWDWFWHMERAVVPV